MKNAFSNVSKRSLAGSDSTRRRHGTSRANGPKHEPYYTDRHLFVSFELGTSDVTMNIRKRVL